jgi:hypothetical protein
MREDCISKIIVLFALFLLTGLSMAAAEDYEIVAFETIGSHTWEVPDNVDEVDVLVVAGGGGGGGRSGAGGGAGGLVFVPDYNIAERSYSVEVGSGGQGGPADGDPTYSGENSSFGNLTAVGGGAGATDNDKTGKTGGSGGGGKYGNDGSAGIQPTLAGKSGTYGYGHKGGYGTHDSWKAGGGGGAGQDGIDGVDDDPGDGGNGIYRAKEDGKTYNFNDIYGDVGEVINGESWFAGGGGGGSHESESYGPYEDAGKGEAGKGGAGHGGIPVGTNACGEDATPNTGGGGGGGSTDGGSGCGGGDGGSGIVLVRYKTGPSICDRRGPLNECISNSSHSISGQSFNVSSVFQAENTAVFEAFSGKATLNITNSTSLSGLWRGEFSIQTPNPRIESGAEFKPENGNIVIGE